MSDDTKVKVVGLTKKFGDLLVLNDISFNVKKGDFVCIEGPTGCGKTTFLNLLVKPVSYTHLDVYKRQELFRQGGVYFN